MKFMHCVFLLIYHVEKADQFLLNIHDVFGMGWFKIYAILHKKLIPQGTQRNRWLSYRTTKIVIEQEASLIVKWDR